MGNKKKKEKHKDKNSENNYKNFHKEKKFSGKNYNAKKENQKTQKMELKEEQELKYLRQVLAEYEFTFQEILQLLEWSQKKRKMYKQLLNAWEESGDIYLKRNGRYTLPEKEGFVKGEISISSGNFGFLDINGEASVFIPGAYLNTAMNGDTVLVRILKQSSDGTKKREGEVYKVIKRNRNVIVGVFENNLSFGFVRPRNSPKDIYIPKKLIRGAKTGDLVAVKVDFWGDEERKPEGAIVSILGSPKDTEALISSLLLNEGIEEKFPNEVLQELDKIDEDISDELKNRKDLRHLDIITIDGSDAKDLDDAVYVEKTEDGYKLFVSIADVSYYVRENTELDMDALKRGNSIYLVDRVIPMLPRKLSNNLCSLNPNEDKLTFTVEMDLDKRGKVVKNDFYKSVIKSKYRMTYENVNTILEKNEESEEYKVLYDKYRKIDEMLKNMLELSKIIRNNKKRRGSIDFELPEIKVVLDENKAVKDIVLRSRGEAERIIEDFMVIANETVAEKLFWEEIPAIYRVHEDPDKAKVQALNETLIKFGYSLKGLEEIHPGKFQNIIERTTGLPEGYLIHKLILRAMQRARYANKNLGHFGLASKYYLHFTSPIRRYSDLIVHRMLGRSIEKFMNEKEKAKYGANFEAIASSISRTERVADKLEEDSVKIKLIEYMQDKIGQVYIARLSGMNKNKIFMELENHIEVVYNVTTARDNFIYDEENFKIVDKRNNESYTMGSTMKVSIVSASYAKMEIEVIPYVEEKVKIDEIEEE
ncbi:ribonuclease R [Leptotrichia buccalis]|uniref:Ribonuclease R n=1 Tax=Leptotrichia buccalis (strain ATCC 14201 / DSM 1135 / JCM 12969 / NCTC 10249 / C-1013-b) TaxID=523794 RepID=C7NCL8_LEPBD|nr:ribonuclease R [Leptotrichia buccalis]ACV39864.1 ribonuclease R [Leptotrichia buccalis C-1013-b]